MDHIIKLHYFLLMAFSFFSPFGLLGQCSNTTQFPDNTVIASSFSDTVIITTEQKAGQYFEITDLILNKSYVFTSSTPGDYITVRDVTTGILLGHGPTPFSYSVGSGPHLVQVQINLSTPPCGDESAYRTTYAICTDCTSIPPGAGVGTTIPLAQWDVAGELRISDSGRPPRAGMIRWNNTTEDFEGYNGNQWLSLTRPNAAVGNWGLVASATFNENNKISASDVSGDDNFGSSVSISGNYAIAGAPFDDVNGKIDQGTAYIFYWTGSDWIQQAQITASDGETDDHFGNSVGISGDYAIVGANWDNDAKGSAYIFHRNGTNWTQQAKIIASDGEDEDLFGNSVSISGDYAIAGAPSDVIGGFTRQGSAYIFQRIGSTWTQQAKVTASGGNEEDRFGISVSISGNYAIVGAQNNRIGGPENPGSAHIFFRMGSSWAEQAKLTASDGEVGDYFGNSVGISGDYAIVGAPYDEVGSGDQGSAYIFIRNSTTWTEQAKIIASDAEINDNFGSSVSISGNYAIVGAEYDDVFGNSGQGSAYIFQLSGTVWMQQAKIISSDGSSNDFFGNSVCIAGNYAIIGARNDEIDTNNGQGSAYIVKKN